MKILLHLGTPKTGSTSLQHSLSAMRRQLKESGIHYPKPSHRREDYHHVLTGLYGNMDAFRPNLIRKFPTTEKASGAAERFLQEAVDGVRKEGAHTLLLSSELLLPNKKKSISVVSSALTSITEDITPIIYVREPASLYRSQLQQNSKRGEFLPPFKKSSIRQQIEQIENAFENRPIVRGFSKDLLEGGDVSKDFFKTVLKVDFEPKTFRSNESLKAEIVCAMLSIAAAIRSNGEAPKEHRLWKLVRLIRKYEDNEGQLSKHEIKPELTRKIRETAIDYVWLKEHYDVDFHELDYSKISDLRPDDAKKFRHLNDVMDVSVEKTIGLILKLSNQL